MSATTGTIGSPKLLYRQLNSKRHAVALLSDDEPRTEALYRLIQRHAAFVDELRIVTDWYMPALADSVSTATTRDAGVDRAQSGLLSSAASSANDSSWRGYSTSLLPSLTSKISALQSHFGAPPTASGANTTAAVLTPPLSPRSAIGALASLDANGGGAAGVGDELARSLLRLSPPAQLAVVFGNIVEVKAVAQRLADELASAFVVVDDEQDPAKQQQRAIYRSRAADTDTNVDKGNAALAASIFVDAMTEYFAAPFEVYCRSMHRAEVMLRLLLRQERFAAKVATVRSAYGAASPGLNELLLAPLRQLSVYSRAMTSLLEATPASDWRERRRLTASIELVNPRLDEIVASVLASASHEELLEIERRLVDHPLGKVALPGRRLVWSAGVELSTKTPPKLKERFVVLFNDMLVWCKERGAALVYDGHLELIDAMLYQPSSQGRPVVLQNNTIVQLVNKRERRLRVYSIRCPTTHARRRLFTALTQRINSYLAVIRDEHKESLEREQDAREARERAEAAAAEQASADTRRLASMERIATQFLQSSERTLRDCVAKFCVVESAFGALQSQLDRFAEERAEIAQLLDALEAQLDNVEKQMP